MCFPFDPYQCFLGLTSPADWKVGEKGWTKVTDRFGRPALSWSRSSFSALLSGGQVQSGPGALWDLEKNTGLRINIPNRRGFALCSRPRGGRADHHGAARVLEVFLLFLARNCRHGDSGLEWMLWRETRFIYLLWFRPHWSMLRHEDAVSVCLLSTCVPACWNY